MTFCPFCGDEVNDDSCVKPACEEKLALAQTQTETAPAESTIAPRAVATAPSPVPAGVGSVADELAKRTRLWNELDGATQLVSAIETRATPQAGTVAPTTEAHARLTPGPDLLAELRTIEAEIGSEVDAIGGRNREIQTRRAEVARLQRQRTILICAIVGGALLAIILLAVALGG